MALSTQRAVSDGTLSTLLLSIDYLDRSEISVYFNEVQAADGTWAWVGTTATQINFTPAVPYGVEVLVKRTTDTSAPRNVFANGAQFTSKTLDENTRQALHAAQEMQEGSGIRDIYNDVNMHGKRISNLGAAVNPGDAVTYGQILEDGSGAGQAVQEFNKRYMGAFASAPTGTIAVGALYYDSVALELRVWSGSAWSAAVGSSLASSLFSGDGVKVAFTLPSTPKNEDNTQVYIGGVYQQKDTYALSGTVLTFSEAPPVGTNNIEVMVVSALSINSVAAASVTDVVQVGTGAVNRTAQAKLRDVVNTKDFGASRSQSLAANREALQKAIAAVNADGGGVVVVDYDCPYGFKTRDSTTWPDFSGCTVPVTLQDSSRGQTQDPDVYPTAYDGSQMRVLTHTPQTTSPGQHDGNTFGIRANWNPNIYTSNDRNVAAVGHASRTASDNYRNGFTVGSDGWFTWSFMQGTVVGADKTREELSNLQIVKFSMPGDTLGDYSPLVVERKTGSMAYGLGTNFPAARHHFGPVAGSPSNYDMMIQSAGTNSQLVLRNSVGAAHDFILRNNNGTFGLNIPSVGDAIQVDYTNRRVWIPGSLQLRFQTVTYGTTVSIDPALGNIFSVTATDTTAFTIGQPALPALPGLQITVTVKNTSGGVIACGWSPAFKLAGAWVQPANGFCRTITFYCDGTDWIEVSRTAADTPN